MLWATFPVITRMRFCHDKRSHQRSMCFCLFDLQLTGCPTGLKDENIQTWEGRQTKSSHVSLTPIHSFPMTQQSTSCFSERWLPVHQHLGLKSRHSAKRRRKTSLRGFSFLLDEKQTGWELRVRNRGRHSYVRMSGVWPHIHPCMLTSWEESLFCWPSARDQQDFLWSSSFLWVRWCEGGGWKGEERGAVGPKCCGHWGAGMLSSV